MIEIDGGCLCGAVRYEAIIDPTKIRICHCNQCQIQSASAFRFGVLVPREHFRLLSGSLKSYTKISESGRPRALTFCPDCGTSLYGCSPTDPQEYSLRLGTARQRRELAPSVQIWTDEALPWLDALPAMPTVAKQSGRPVNPGRKTGASAGDS
ncbi:MAG: GFA family protein [Burkholderiales bacterium]|jgi:hypothetical protein